MSRIPRQPIDTLEAPGTASLPVFSQSARMAEQLNAAIGGIGAFATDLAVIDRAADARKRAEDERVAELDRGRARRDAATHFQQDQPLIQSEKLTPDSYDNLPGSVEALLSPRLEGHSEAYRNQYLETAQAAYVGQFADQLSARRDRAIVEAVGLIGNNVAAAKSPEEVTAQESEYLKLDARHTKTAFLQDVVTPAMKKAAAAGDEARFNTLAGYLTTNKSGQAEVQLGRVAVKEAQNRALSDAVDAFHDDIAGMLTGGAGFDAVVDRIRSYSGKLNARFVEAELRGVTGQHDAEAGQAREDENRAKAEAVTGFQNDIARLYNDGASFAEIRKGITGYRGKVDERYIDSELQALNSQEGAFATRNREATERAAKDDIAGARMEGQSFEALQAKVLSYRGKIGDDIVENELQSVTRLFQGRSEDQLRNAIINDSLTPVQLVDEIKARAALPDTDPNHLDPHTAQTLLSEQAQEHASHLARDQVIDALKGGDLLATESQHGSAFVKLVGPEGYGLIDAHNKIVDPAKLGADIARLRLFPQALQQTVVSNLQDPDPAAAAAGAQVAGMLSQTSPRLYAQLVEEAGPGTRAMLDKAAEEYQFKRLQTPESQSASVDRIRAAGQAEKDRPPPDQASTAYAEFQMGGQKAFETYLADLVTKAGGNVAWADDWFNNPDVEDRQGAHGEMRRWYIERYNQLPDATEAQRKTEAGKYATSQLRNNYDFVRWNDVVAPVSIKGDNGQQLPENLRWGQGYAEEAHADLKAAGFDESKIKILGLKPFTTPRVEQGENPEGKMGWAFVVPTGILVNDQGDPVVYRPTDQAQTNRAKMQQAIADQEAAYSKRMEGPAANYTPYFDWSYVFSGR